MYYTLKGNTIVVYLKYEKQKKDKEIKHNLFLYILPSFSLSLKIGVLKREQKKKKQQINELKKHLLSVDYSCNLESD